MKEENPVVVGEESKEPAEGPHGAPKFAAVVLAAGTSSRMGQSKALMRFRGKTFIAGILDTIRDAAIDYAIVAVSLTDTKILSDIDLTNTSVVYNNADKAAGPIESIRPAIVFCVNHMVEYLMIWPVDQPHIKPNTISTLINTVRDQRPLIAVPKFRGKRGHPVVFSKAIFPELLSSVADQGANRVVLRVPSRVAEIPVEDSGVLEDIDTPEDYNRLLLDSS